jgi:hypothetical protein
VKVVALAHYFVASGAGLTQGIESEEQLIRVSHTGADSAAVLPEFELTGLVHAPGESMALPASCRMLSPGEYEVRFIPHVAGIHSLDIYLNGSPIPSSPINVTVARVAPFFVLDFAESLEQIVEFEPTTFRVANQIVNISSPLLVEAALENRKDIDFSVAALGGGSYECIFNAPAAGEYTLHVNIQGHSIPGSPFSLVVNGLANFCKAWGDGLSYAVEDDEALFFLRCMRSTRHRRLHISAIVETSAEPIPASVTEEADDSFSLRCALPHVCKCSDPQESEPKLGVQVRDRFDAKSDSGFQVPASPACQRFGGMYGVGCNCLVGAHEGIAKCCFRSLAALSSSS